MQRIEVNLQTGEQQVIDLTQEEIEVAQAQFATWQVEETIRLAKVAEEEAKQAKFQQWLNSNNI